AWVRDYYEAVHPYSGFEGGYTNFMAADDQARVRENYGPSFERLRRGKAAWDPDNLLRRNQNGGPAEAGAAAAREGRPAAGRAGAAARPRATREEPLRLRSAPCVERGHRVRVLELQVRVRLELRLGDREAQPDPVRDVHHERHALGRPPAQIPEPPSLEPQLH